MTQLQAYQALLCVALIAGGQVLFRVVGMQVEAAGTWMRLRVLLVGCCALALYLIATLLWIHVLRTVTLSRAYPLMALSFVAVPLLSRVLLHEEVSHGYFAGVLLITLGVALTMYQR